MAISGKNAKIKNNETANIISKIINFFSKGNLFYPILSVSIGQGPKGPVDGTGAKFCSTKSSVGY